MKSTWQLLGVIVALVTALLAFGTAGYRAIEPGWSLGEAFFMTVITISTVGFSEIHPLSPPGRLFTVLLIFLGLFVLSVIGTYGARLLIDHEVKSVLGRKRMKKDIAQLKDHYVVCGFGRIGSVICEELNRAGLAFVIIEIEDTLVENAENLGYRIIKGDATSDSVLKQAGVDRAHGVVAALNSDAHNLFISLAARELNANVEIIARGEETGIESRLLRAGANRVVSPLKLGGSQIAHMILGDLRSESKKQEAAPEMGQLMMQQIQNTRNIQVCTEDLLEQAGGVLAVAIQRADGRKEIMPSLTTLLEPRDTLFVCRAPRTP